MFTVIGERINGTRATIRAAIAARDAAVIRAEAVHQAQAGAVYLDVNAGAFPATEIDDLCWLLAQVQAATPTPVCLDAADPRVILAGLDVLDGRPALINAVSLRAGDAEVLLPAARRYGAGVIGSCLDDAGIPATAEERLANATRLLALTRKAGFPDDAVWLDPLVQPIATGPAHGTVVLHAIALIRQAFPAAHVCIGASNISFGMPRRAVLNRAFLALAIAEGLDAALLDPTDAGMLDSLWAARAVCGLDGQGLAYLDAMRQRREASE